MNRWVLGLVAAAAVLVGVLVGVGEGGGASAASGLLIGAVVALGAGLVLLWSRQGGLEAERDRLHALVARTDDQLRLGERLATQTEALPAAAEALGGLVERVAALESSWASTHRRATEETLAVVRDAILAFRADAKQAIEEGARVAKEAVTPLVDTIVEGTASAGRELIAAQDARLAELEAAQQARGEALLAKLGDAVAALRDVGAEQASAIGGFAQEAETRMLRQETERTALLQDLVATLEDAQRGQAAQRAALEVGLVEAGGAAVDALQARLEAHAVALAERLDVAGSRVDEAAALAQAGGAELGALAEMFGAAVDRQNEGARAWLESLSAVDSAVETAGRGAAAQALEAQLVETKGVFARQLEFQRELFEQVRGLRDDVDALRGSPRGERREAGDAEREQSGSEEQTGV